LVGGIAGRLQLRVAGDLQLVLADGRVERLTQQLLAGLGTDLLAEALLDHAARHLARAEALEPGGPGDLAQALVDLALQPVGRETEGQAAFVVTELIDRGLHIDSGRYGAMPRHE